MCHRGFRVAYNGLCAFASVNHLHVHGWYFDMPLFTESMVSDCCHHFVRGQRTASACRLTVNDWARAFSHVSAENLHGLDIGHVEQVVTHLPAVVTHLLMVYELWP